MRGRTQVRVLFGVLILIGFLPSARAAMPPTVSDEWNGQEAPAFFVSSVKGTTVSLEDFRGRPILVNFFASWCPPCRSEIRQLGALSTQHSKDGLAVIGLAVDSVLTLDTVGDV